MARLWEVNHPYHCQVGSYFEKGHHHEFDFWGDFILEWGDDLKNKVDMNLIFRFDWLSAEDLKSKNDQVYLYIFHQRKARNSSISIEVKPDDKERVEEELIKLLIPHWERLNEIWVPISYEFEIKIDDTTSSNKSV